MTRLAGKVAIVTGGASGIGAAAARAFARAGAAVLVADWDAERGAGVAAGIERAAFRRCDVSDDAQVADMVAEAVERFGRPDVLFNNAGVMPSGSLFSQTLADWDRVMAINLRGVFTCSRHMAAARRAAGGGAGGSIVNTASPTGLLGYPDLLAYSASKGGVLALTRAMAVELAPDIRVNAIVPGTTRTGILEDYLDTVADRDAALAAFGRQHPLGRIAEPEDVAAAAVYLASDDAAFVTGSTLSVDGGLTILKGNPG